MPASLAARWCAVLCLVAAACLPADAVGRDKTDVIRLVNGDRITGEILGLQYGRLQVKTDSLGTVYVEWPDVASLESRYAFLLEHIGGRQAYGALQGGEGTIAVVAGDEVQQVPLREIVRMGQVEDDFWDRLEGSVSIGVNYAKSTSTSVSSARFDATYRSRATSAGLEGSFDRTSTPARGTSDRLRLAYTQSFLRPRARYWIGLGSFERNEELGVEGRLQAGAAHGWRFYEAQDSTAAVYTGVVVNQEWVTGLEGSQQNIEGVIGLQWRIYRFATPETSLTSSLAAYPSLTEAGRVRARTDVSLRRKLAGDFTLQLSLYGDYDSRPPGDVGVTADYGFVTSLGYSF
jgi:hypothetical protein